MGRVITMDGSDTLTLELYFNDLTPEAQALYLDFQGLENAKEGNLDRDIVPIHILTRCKMEEDE